MRKAETNPRNWRYSGANISISLARQEIPRTLRIISDSQHHHR